ncbi:hypothetical protein L2E82_04739 [Cichorium intybus]|uniref:Uncharacterized protein n=1 Tax=Cichorium intybus TaxID=13427 RepID=A0ACB9H6H2_CICIN|nr:hypothetical protein L2E82_04739 [Cichorium intybus]
MPSLSSIIVNRYKLKESIISYNVIGMGCSAGLMVIGLAEQLLQVHHDTYALLMSTKSNTENCCLGDDRSKRYGLFGLNGCGKSTLLILIGMRELPILDHMDIFHLTREIEASDMSSLEVVMNCDEERIKLEAEVECIAVHDAGGGEALNSLKAGFWVRSRWFRWGEGFTGCNSAIQARIKKIMQADEDVGKIAMAVPVLVSKALELFLQDLCDQVVNKVPDYGHSDAAVDDRTMIKRKKAAAGETNESDEELKRNRMNEARQTGSNGKGRGRGRGQGAWQRVSRKRAVVQPITTTTTVTATAAAASDGGPDFDLNAGVDENMEKVSDGLDGGALQPKPPPPPESVPAGGDDGLLAADAVEVKNEDYIGKLLSEMDRMVIDTGNLGQNNSRLDDEDEDYDEE